MFGLSVFLRDGYDVDRIYFATRRGVERRGSVWTLGSPPFGRQESWEGSPGGWPQSAPNQWWRRHDEYGSERKDHSTAVEAARKPTRGIASASLLLHQICCGHGGARVSA